MDDEDRRAEHEPLTAGDWRLLFLLGPGALLIKRCCRAFLQGFRGA